MLSANICYICNFINMRIKRCIEKVKGWEKDFLPKVGEFKDDIGFCHFNRELLELAVNLFASFVITAKTLPTYDISRITTEIFIYCYNYCIPFSLFNYSFPDTYNWLSCLYHTFHQTLKKKILPSSPSSPTILWLDRFSSFFFTCINWFLVNRYSMDISQACHDTNVE